MLEFLAKYEENMNSNLKNVALHLNIDKQF